jgi:DNA polymerase III delta prime subunit
MSFTQKSKGQVDQVAAESLAMMANVADRAQSELRSNGPGATSLASVNTLTSARAVQHLNSINIANLEGNQILIREPAIARVVVLDEDAKERVYYICRAAPVTGIAGLLASYKAPAGRLASLPIGAEFRLPNGDLLEVIERARLRPEMAADGWDSHDTIFETENFGPVTIESLRALLRHATPTDQIEDLLSKMLVDDAESANIVDGVRRSLITKMGLRDQPVLDQYQDEIFRLPLDQRLLILGPPGTGKTTTLIRRLGQKLDSSYLSEEEQQVASAASQSGTTSHSDSWVMFTPTELLKVYLKEAFAREGVPASDKHLRTWSDYRRQLGRNTLNILRTTGSSGTFTLKDSAITLGEESIAKSTEWYADFDGWQRNTYIVELQQAAKVLAGSTQAGIANVGTRLTVILDEARPLAMPVLFVELSTEVATVQTLVNELKKSSDTKIKNALNLAINHEHGFLDSLAKFIDQLRVTTETEADDLDDQEDQDSEDEDPALPKTGRGAAMAVFFRAVRAQARLLASSRSVSKSSRSGKIIEWIGERSLNAVDRSSVGEQLIVLVAARRFVSPIKRYLDGVPKRYRTFRRVRQEVKIWYSSESFPATDLHPLELDLLLLTSLRAAGELLNRPNIARRIDEPYWSALQTMQGLYKHQILVDEATDFSPIQLGCMAALAHPQIRSFFACGDFNQRLTTWGSRTVADVRWVFPEIDIREISVAYRQSRQLNDLARSIVTVLGGGDRHVSLPANVDSDGQFPVLLEGVTDLSNVVAWLAARIREIEQFLGQLPSTAVFVNTEVELQNVADALNAVLEDSNIRVVACPKGQVMGQDNDVRVFDIQHIKGLEFEAVFFVGIDRLAFSQPTLFDKYLYVGTTRAATYLGLTCDGSLPHAMENLRTHFVSNWSQS